MYFYVYVTQFIRLTEIDKKNVKLLILYIKSISNTVIS